MMPDARKTGNTGPQVRWSVGPLVRGGASRAFVAFLAGSAVLAAPLHAGAQSNASKRPTNTYWVYVGAESADLIHRLRFGPEGFVVERTTTIGELPNEMEGPHGLQVSPDGKFLYMTTGHGRPDGKLWKYELGEQADTLVGEGLSLGFFPASLDLTPDGLYSLSVNFNLHGDMVPSTVSVVFTPTNTEVARMVTCTMPHGSRVDPSGTRQYSTCMMDDQLVEIDARKFELARRFSLAKGKEGPIAADEHAGHVMPPAGAPKPVVDPAEVGLRRHEARHDTRNVFAHVGAAIVRRPQDLCGVQQVRRDYRSGPRQLDADSPPAHRPRRL